MGKMRKTKIITILILFVVVLGVSVGFAAFSSVLTISSRATVNPSSGEFFVKFSTNESSLVEDAVLPSDITTGLSASNAVIDNSVMPTLSNLKVDFTAPGQYVEYTFYARNEGAYTAYLNSVNFVGEKSCEGKNGASESLVRSACDSIEISVDIGGNVYNAQSPVSNHPLAIGEGEMIVVRLSYNGNGAYVDGEMSISFPNIALVYSTIDDPSMPPILPGEKVVRLESGDLDTPGSIVSIGNEKFYVVVNDGINVRLFAKYNLYVGNIATGTKEVEDPETGSTVIDMVYSPITNPTGLQDSSAIGYVEGENYDMRFPFVGTVPFSDDSKKGDVPSDYSGSIIEGYVNDYRDYLESLGVTVTEARLVTLEELEAFGCSSSEKSCKNAPKEVYSSSYWVGTAGNSDAPYMVLSNGGLGAIIYYWAPYYAGVRPIIEVPITEF